MTEDAAATPDAEHGRATHVRDRVSQAYLGMLDLGPTGDRLRRRIDWMAEQAQGPRVLDVGCSEGMLELLLARRGIGVTGVDADPEAIEFASELLGKESADVRERVEIVRGDFIRPGVVQGLFDTVVLGDILDRIDDPGAMLERCLEHLRPEGRILVTIYLGLDPGEDRRQAMRLTDIINLLEPRFALHMMEFEDEHVRFVGRLSEGREVSWDRLDAQAVLSMTEAALVGPQQRAQELERQMQVDRIALSQHKIAASQFKKGLDAKSGEVRVLRHRLQAMQSSISFRAGSAMVRAAKQPRTLWKLPFQLLRLYRSASRPASEITSEDDPGPNDISIFPKNWAWISPSSSAILPCPFLRPKSRVRG